MGDIIKFPNAKSAPLSRIMAPWKWITSHCFLHKWSLWQTTKYVHWTNTPGGFRIQAKCCQRCGYVKEERQNF